MLKKQVRNELDSILNDLRVNLSNNYKDLAHDALKRLHVTLDAYLEDGTLKEKEYKKYKQIADDYTVRLADYHH